MKHLPKVSYLSGQGDFFPPFLSLFLCALMNLTQHVSRRDSAVVVARQCLQSFFSSRTSKLGGGQSGEEERKALLFGSVKSSVETCLFRVVLSCRTDKKKNPT